MKWSGTLAGIAGALAFGTVLACDDSPAAPEAEADQTDGVRFGRTSVNGVAPPYPCGVIDANGVVRLTLDWQAIVTPGGLEVALTRAHAPPGDGGGAVTMSAALSPGSTTEYEIVRAAC